MHDGVIVEMGATADVFERPQDPYTQLLLASVPRLAAGTIPVVDSGGTEQLAELEAESA
jgi:ABC-type oligopeptide transport system ATPase subunit